MREMDHLELKDRLMSSGSISSRSSKGRRGGVVLVTVAIVFIALPVWAATPQKIIISGGALAVPVEVSQPKDVDDLIKDLCSGARAQVSGAQTPYDVAVQWTDNLMWRGKLFRGTDSILSVDIPDWRLHTSDSPEPQTCDHRVVGKKALAILDRYGVPTTPDGGETVSDKGSYRGRYVPLQILAAGLLLILIVAYGLVRVVRRRRA